MLDQETLARVEGIESQLREIDEKIYELHKSREQVMCTDQGYKEYLERYRALWPTPIPLTFRHFYEAKAQLDNLNARLAEHPQDSEEWHEFAERNAKRFVRLERELAIWG